MYSQESLSLIGRFEPSHSSLSHPGRFVRLLGPIVRVSSCGVNNIRHQFSMCYTVTSQLVRHDPSRLATRTPHEPFELSSVPNTKLDTPESDGFVADSDASFCEQILNITVA
jgi:hypothetical protein